MIGPFEEYAELALHIDGGEGMRYLDYMLEPPAQTELDRIAEEHAKHLGIEMQDGVADGMYFVATMPDGSERHLLRSRLYSLTPRDQLELAVRTHIEQTYALFGKGRAWTLGGRVHPVRDGDAFVAALVRGEPHVLMRSFTCHENGPQYGKPHATTPG